MMRTLNFIVKITLVIYISFGFISSSIAQIPNPDFEEWEEITFYDPFGVPVIYEKPINWSVNQYFDLERVQKSTDSQSGNYSLKMISTSSVPVGIASCTSLVSTNVDFTTPIEQNKSLFFYYKSISNNNEGDVYFRIVITFYLNGVFNGQVNWNDNTETLVYTLAEIPLIENSDAIIIDIYGGSVDSPTGGCIPLSTIWVDNLTIGESILSSTDKLLIKKIITYPNPVKNILHVYNNGNIEFENITIFDILGKIVLFQNDSFDKLNLSNIKSGVLFIKIETKKGIFIKKIIKK